MLFVFNHIWLPFYDLHTKKQMIAVTCILAFIYCAIMLSKDLFKAATVASMCLIYVKFM